MTPSTALDWIVGTILFACVAIGLLVFFHGRHEARKRAKFKPSVIVRDELLFFRVGGWHDWTYSKERAQIFRDYYTAFTVLKAIREKYPNAELKEI